MFLFFRIVLASEMQSPALRSRKLLGTVSVAAFNFWVGGAGRGGALRLRSASGSQGENSGLRRQADGKDVLLMLLLIRPGWRSAGPVRFGTGKGLRRWTR